MHESFDFNEKKKFYWWVVSAPEIEHFGAILQDHGMRVKLETQVEHTHTHTEMNVPSFLGF